MSEVRGIYDEELDIITFESYAYAGEQPIGRLVTRMKVTGWKREEDGTRTITDVEILSCGLRVVRDD